MEVGGVRGPDHYAGVCGTYWEGQAWYEQLLFSCSCQEAFLGEGACPVRLCAKRRRVDHCGLCAHFPCELLFSFAARGPEDLRVFSSARRAEYGDGAWAAWAREQLASWVQAHCPLWELARAKPPDPIRRGPYPSCVPEG
ncbi:MAG: DUF3795 domain-containing protein [Armatimonadota bacterium]|nr:DUF3795 domain-containing protein [Armatimonadota bacterium]MDW8156242.1 DUF3795 domain-containing protein [Armatimonadota bacterium]